MLEIRSLSGGLLVNLDISIMGLNTDNFKMGESIKITTDKIHGTTFVMRLLLEVEERKILIVEPKVSTREAPHG